MERLKGYIRGGWGKGASLRAITPTELRRRLAQAGQRRYEHRFRADRFVEATERRLQTLLESHRAAAPVVAAGEATR